MNKVDLIRSRIYSADLLLKQCHVWRFKEKKIVFTNGCFDILHLGHIEYLSKAAELGNILVIGLNTDASVRKIKGEHRPVNDENSRAMLLASLTMVNAVVLFDEETPYELIRMIRPDVLVKGKDYLPDEIVGQDIVLAKGGQVVTVELTEGYSTSAIENRILELHKKV
jgi:D-glycero-beta-D-manno-heptose 1-phosphate adenylyltransferase